MTRPPPDWFPLGEKANSEVMSRIADAVSALKMPLQAKMLPKLGHWFLLDSLLLANQANRDGMHANALALTRQCVEAVGIIEVGICGHREAGATLLRWEADRLNPGELRAWLEANVWPSYGTGLWDEKWSTFMREFAAAVQPYAHYGRSLAQWQLRLHAFQETVGDPEYAGHLIVEMRPRAYDAQKATRITLFHSILAFTLGRIWIAANPGDKSFSTLIDRLGAALGKSRYLDGHQTDWRQQFWAAVWEREGNTILE